MPSGGPGVAKTPGHRAKIAAALRGKAKTRQHREALSCAARSGDDRPFIERFEDHVKVGAQDECWPWQGAVTWDGYGVLYEMGECLYAHRVAYELRFGPVVPGLDVDHVCHNRDVTCVRGPTCEHRRCCNPRHLEPVTHAENCQRPWVVRRIGSV